MFSECQVAIAETSESLNELTVQQFGLSGFMELIKNCYKNPTDEIQATLFQVLENSANIHNMLSH